MPNPTLELLAWARLTDETEIGYLVCLGRNVELTIGGPGGLTIDATQQGLLSLLCAVSGALYALQQSYDAEPAA